MVGDPGRDRRHRSTKILETMLEFLKTGKVTTTRLSIPIQFRPVREFSE